MILTPSSTPVQGTVLGPLRDPLVPLRAVALGGPTLNATPYPVGFVLPWVLEYVAGSLVLSREGVPAESVPVAGVTWVSLAFNQSMQQHMAYSVGGDCFMRWFDTLTEEMETITITGGSTPIVFLDDSREVFTGQSDVHFAYVRAGGLYVRSQRDRFLIEYTQKSSGVGRLRDAGMSSVGRVQFNYTET